MNRINNLTIEDIHDIRNENYEKTKDLSFSELICKTSQKAQAFKKGLTRYAQLHDEDGFKAYTLTEPEATYTKDNR